MMSKKKKIILSILAAIPLLLTGALIVIVLFLDSIVASGVTVFGSKMTGTEVKVADVSISLLSPRLKIDAFSIGNPSGYTGQYAFELDQLVAAVDRGSLFSDRIIVEEILIDGARINFEPRLTGANNLSDIRRNVEKMTAARKEVTATDTATAPAADSGSKKTVTIRRLRVINCRIMVTGKLLPSGVAVPLPDIELRDIGGDTSSPEDVFGTIYDALLKDIVGAVSKAAPGGLKLPGIEGSDLIDKTRKEGEKAIDSIRSLF